MNLLRLSMPALFAAVILTFTAGIAAPSEQSAVMTTVQQFMTGLNKGDAKTTLATCTSPASVIDEFPPHEWQGPMACADWLKDFRASLKSAGVTSLVLTLGLPKHVDITGDRAYVVVPASYTAKLAGKPIAERGSIFTVALKKIATQWRITGWAWTKQ